MKKILMLKINKPLFCIATIVILLGALQNRFAWADTNSTQPPPVKVIQSSPNAIYPGETLLMAKGYPSLVKFTKGDPSKPLIVFIPGNGHLGRIAYGYPGGNKKDFLEYWMNKKGYSFLSISYPLENNAIYSENYPAFGLDDYGHQISAISRYFINNNHLPSNVIVILWSGAGRLSYGLNKKFATEGLDLSFIIALNATPPIPGLSDSTYFHLPKNIKPASSGYLDIFSSLVSWFTNALTIQNQINHHTIIPETIYRSQFIGNSPLFLIDQLVDYKNNGVQSDPQLAWRAFFWLDFKNYPLVAVIHDNSSTDPAHPLLDKQTWNFINSQKIFAELSPKLSQDNLSLREWDKLRNTMMGMPEQLTMTVNGTHFSFVGEKGAKETAEAIDILKNRVVELKNSLK